MRNPKEYRSPELKFRLSFDEGYAEMPIYSVKGSTKEKWKGLNSIKLFMDNFNLSLNDIAKHIEEQQDRFLHEINGISQRKALTRDEYGNLASPFRSQKKLI